MQLTEQLSELQKIILEILLEQPDLAMNQEALVKEVIKRQNRIKELSDIQ